MNISPKSYLTSIPPQMRGYITQYLTPLECAQSLFPACTALRNDAQDTLTWQKLNVVVMNPPGIVSRCLSDDLQDFTVGHIAWYNIRRDQKLQHIPDTSEVSDSPPFSNTPPFYLRNGKVIKLYKPTDNGLQESEILQIKTEEPNLEGNISIHQVDDCVNGQKISKLKVLRGTTHRVCSLENNMWVEKVRTDLFQYDCTGPVLIHMRRSLQFFDWVNNFAPIDDPTSNQKKYSHLEHLYFKSRDDIEALHYVKTADRRSLEVRWRFPLPKDAYTSIRNSNNNFLLLQLNNQYIVLSAKTGELVYDLSGHEIENCWLRRDAVIFINKSNQLFVVDLSSPNKTTYSLQLPGKVSFIAYRIFSQTPTLPAKHDLFVFVDPEAKINTQVLALQCDEKAKAAEKTPAP